MTVNSETTTLTPAPTDDGAVGVIEVTEVTEASRPKLPEGIRVLVGHTSEETAYIQPDYPYSWKLRCERGVWVETTKHGMRWCYRTSNPKRAGTSWNASKKGGYHPLTVMTLDENPASDQKGHIEVHSFRPYGDNEKELDIFLALYGAALADPASLRTIRHIRAVIRAERHIKVTVRSPGDDDAAFLSPREQVVVWVKQIGVELRALEAES